VITDGRDKKKKRSEKDRERESILLTVSDRPRGDVFFFFSPRIETREIEKEQA
jgi:hypothetical protein